MVAWGFWLVGGVWFQLRNFVCVSVCVCRVRVCEREREGVQVKSTLCLASG